jgi:hypothetical protein
MSRSRLTTNGILKLAEKRGIDVHIKYGPDGRITDVLTIGGASEPSGDLIDSETANPWLGVRETLLDAKKKQPS